MTIEEIKNKMKTWTDAGIELAYNSGYKNGTKVHDGERGSAYYDGYRDGYIEGLEQGYNYVKYKTETCENHEKCLSYKNTAQIVKAKEIKGRMYVPLEEVEAFIKRIKEIQDENSN